jgi:hypothetical protein
MSTAKPDYQAQLNCEKLKFPKVVNVYFHRNPLVTDERLSKQGISIIIIDNYIVFYILFEEHKRVTILRILHSRRDWVKLL